MAEEKNVGLFIDWDNLAISIAADMNGATPDVKRIVQKAQEYGRIIIARAYAEWNTMSERLSVYRAGVEPVYAPTFRFETDPVTQISRGKSLADPVMVADCVDALHILPQVTTFVMVSGDKDLIPVVRLAQLRGRKVVVIGPDLVAAVLKDMADEFVSYRSLVEPSVPEQYTAHPERTREPAAPSRRQPQGRQQVHPVRGLAPQVQRQVTPAAEEREPEPAAPDLSTVYNTIVDVLQHMATNGRTRVRATNLKDQLLLRIPGFTERKYGFSKFKDLLVAAERAGLLRVSAAGPVHWVSLPEVKAEEAPAREAETAPPPVEAVQPESPAVEEVVPTADEQERRLAVVRFIDELRKRSRWLTYTFVLTNVIGFLGRLVPASQAEAESRSILNYLVGEGALRIDKVPQEVDVGGIKHRVRMCHFVEDHELVREARAATFENIPADLLPPTPEEAPAGAEQPASPADAEVAADRTAPSGEPNADLANTAPAEVGEQSNNGRPAEETLEPPMEVTPAEPVAPVQPPRSRRGRRRSRASAERAAEATPAPEEAPAEAEASEPGAVAEPEVATGPEVATEPEEAAVPEPVQVEAKETLAAEPERPSLEEVFVEAQRILNDLALEGKERVTGSSLKLRLSRSFPGFHERRFGFAKFKDFLLAAEREGYASVDVEGQVNWVRVPRVAAEAQPVEAQQSEAAPEVEPEAATESTAQPEPEAPSAEAAPEEQPAVAEPEAPSAEAAPEPEPETQPAEPAATAEETPAGEETAEASSREEEEES